MEQIQQVDQLKELMRQLDERVNADAGEQPVSVENVYDMEQRKGSLPSLASVMEVFDSTIEQEDYLMGETTQPSAENGLIEHLIFGRNEPALHHYHNTFRAALQMPPLEVYSG